VLDIQNASAEPEPEPEPVQDAVSMVRDLAERVANLPPVPDPLPPPDPERELARAVAEQVANLDTPQPQQDTHLLHLTPSAPAAPELPAPQQAFMSSDEKLLSIEALLKERQRAFIELVTTAETLRMKVARLEEILDERDRELTRLRVLRASA